LFSNKKKKTKLSHNFPSGVAILSHPDIMVTDQKYFLMEKKKEQISDILFFGRKGSSLRSRHLVLWSLGTLTGQQRFFGTDWLREREDIITP
jgi:hypothetical protein